MVLPSRQKSAPNMGCSDNSRFPATTTPKVGKLVASSSLPEDSSPPAVGSRANKERKAGCRACPRPECRKALRVVRRAAHRLRREIRVVVQAGLFLQAVKAVPAEFPVASPLIRVRPTVRAAESKWPK